MKLKEFQEHVRCEDTSVTDRLKQIGRSLRVLAQQAAYLGYSLEEIASINVEDEG